MNVKKPGPRSLSCMLEALNQIIKENK